MPKTYNLFSPVSTGDVLTATTFNNLLTNTEGYRIPAMCVLLNSSVSVTSSPAKIAFSSEEIDTDGMHDNVTNNTRVTIQTAGIYVVLANVYNGASSATGFFELMKNNSTVGSMTSPTNASYAPSGTVSYVASLVATDYLEVRCASTTTQNLSVRLSAIWVGQAS